MARRLLFLTRQGCHLCEEALALFRGRPLEIIDIDLDPDLLLLYDDRVPVVLDPVTGDVLLEGVMTEDQVRELRN